MNDIISRNMAIKAIEDLPNCYNGYSDTFDKACIIGVLEELAPIDESVRHARWTEHKDYPEIAWLCSECGYFTTMRTYHYCPNCGAKMDEERKEE